MRRKNPETVGAVHTHTHTHTSILTKDKKINESRNDKSNYGINSIKSNHIKKNANVIKINVGFTAVKIIVILLIVLLLAIKPVMTIIETQES